MSTARQSAGRSGRPSLPPAMRETRLPPISRPARIYAEAASSTPPAQAVSPRRSYGSGSLFSKAGSWYGQWWVGERRVKRKLGPVREPGTRDGLTKAQAERELRRRMDTEGATPRGERLTVSEGAERLIDHLEAYGLKATTIATYRSLSRTHFERHFPDQALARITTRDVERMVAAMRRGGAGAKLINNAITLLGQVFDHGLDRGWCNANPARKVRRPRVEQSDAIRFLDQAEVEAMLRAAASDTDRALFLTAVMTGLRQGELLGLQWRDVDWQAGKLHVRRSYVRGHWGTPKSRRSSRAVPMAYRVARELARHHQHATYKADDDLVFCHRDIGTVLDHSALVRRFKRALSAGGVREVRFHDLRHTFGTRMASVGVPMRTLQEWMGHRDFKTTLIYADYAPSGREAELMDRAFGKNLEPDWSPARTAGKRPTVAR
jgi:integrase